MGQRSRRLGEREDTSWHTHRTRSRPPPGRRCRCRSPCPRATGRCRGTCVWSQRQTPDRTGEAQGTRGHSWLGVAPSATGVSESFCSCFPCVTVGSGGLHVQPPFSSPAPPLTAPVSPLQRVAAQEGRAGQRGESQSREASGHVPKGSGCSQAFGKSHKT